MDIKGDSSEVSDANEELIIGNRTKGGPCYKVANNLTKLDSHVSWKVELVSDEIGYLAQEISKQNIDSMAWFLPTTYRK